MNNLVKKKCVPCEVGGTPLSVSDALKLQKQVPSWSLSGDGKSISRDWKFKDFVGAMRFVNSVADTAEEEGHHPDIHISYNKDRLEMFTHAIGGLSENDFILA